MVAGTGWLRVGPLSQLVMRSFDVADRGGWVVVEVGGRRPTKEER